MCVAIGTEAYEIAQQRLHPNQIVEVATLDEVYTQFGDGCCNVIGTDYAIERTQKLVEDVGGYSGPYALGPSLFTKQPYAVATKKVVYSDENVAKLASDDDPLVFTKFVDWVVQAIIAAEEKNITQATATDFAQTIAFGVQYKDMFRHAIAAVGNYGEIYARYREPIIPRAGMNLINDGSSGLHYHRSIGDVTDYGPDPYENMTLNNILKRGTLLCGIPVPSSINLTPMADGVGSLSPLGSPPPQSQLMAAMQGEPISPASLQEIMEGAGANIDIEYCRALTSSIFQGRFSIHDSESCQIDTHSQNYTESTSNPTLKFIILWNLTDGFAKLQSGEIDVVAGYRMDLQSDVKEATTGDGFTFSQPYFYGATTTEQHVSE